MNQYTVFAIGLAAFLLPFFWFFPRPENGNGRPSILVPAHLLRRAGRWLWASDEAVKIGFFHARQVHDRLNLDLDPSDSGGQH
jgi:hypothetical protein